MEERVGNNEGVGGFGEIREFNNFIEQMDVEDLPLVGRNFTSYRPNGKARNKD